MATHKALGRGLQALLRPVVPGLAADDRQSVAKIPVGKIRPNRHQPRTRFPAEALQELADSIKTHGVAQPLIVSPSVVPGEYELIAGERRLRAAVLAGLAEVPCVVRSVSERERHELSLIENIQREDLNAVETAESMRKLMDEFDLTQEDMARALGMSRSAVANKLRLLELPQLVRNALVEALLSEGHARALLGLSDKEDQAEMGKRIVQEKLTVRDVEKIVAGWTPAARNGSAKAAKRKNPDVRHVEEDLQRALSRRVEIDSRAKNKGWVKLEFYSIDDLQVLVHQLKGKRDSHHK